MNIYDAGFTYVKYKKPVNGYKVDAIWFPIGESIWGLGNLLTGPAILRFHDGSRGFTILHEQFFPSASIASKAEDKGIMPTERSIILDYEDTKDGEKYPYHDIFKGYAPFFFIDVNFDGKKDLVLNYRNQGQRHTNMYRAYLRDGDYFDTDLLYRQTEKMPFREFDDLTEFDSTTKQIILHSHGGAFSWTKEYYEKNKNQYARDEFDLVKIQTRQDRKIYEYGYAKQLISESALSEEE